MSKTNKERLQDNNLELQNIKTGIDNLPDYIDVKPIYGRTTCTDFDTTNLTRCSSLVDKYFTSITDSKASIYKYENGNVELVKDIYTNNTYVKFVSIIKVVDDVIYIAKAENRSNYSISNVTCSKIENGVETELFTKNIGNNTYANGMYGFDNRIYFWHPGKMVYIDIDNQTITSKTGFPDYSYDTSKTVIFNKDVLYTNADGKRCFYDINTGNKWSLSNNQIVSFVDTLEQVVCINNNLYAYNSNRTIGNLIKENFIPNYVNSTDVFCVNVAGDTYIYNKKVLRLDRSTYTLIDTGYSYGNLTSDAGVGNFVYKYLKTTVNSRTRTLNYTADVTDLLGYSYNGVNFYKNKLSSLSTDRVLIGQEVYDRLGVAYEGVMPNNGALNYTPTTSQQTIPAGYTSGGIIEAIDYSGQGALSPQDTATAEAQIEDLFGEGE